MMGRPQLFVISLGLILGISHSQTTETVSFKVGGVQRSFELHIPGGFSQELPLVLFVHGYGGSGKGFANETQANGLADREGFIAVHPSAVTNSWSMQDTSEYPFLLAIIDSVNVRHKVDRNRVYCAGFSQGGFISFGLGYKHPEVFAAVAPVSGHIPSFSTAKPLSRPVPILITFGTKDMPPLASFDADIETWKKLDSCSNTKTVVKPYPASKPNSVVARISYTSCAQGSEVVVDSVIGGTHIWNMNTTNNVNTTEEVWAFFKKHAIATKPATPSVRFFRNTNYDGLLASLSVGSYTLAQLNALGIPNNEISSFEVDSGLYVELFDEDQHSSPLGAFQTSTPNLISAGINDKVSSLRIATGELPSNLMVLNPKSAVWNIGPNRIELYGGENVQVQLELLDGKGRRQALLYEGVLGKGATAFDLSAFPSGIYIARLLVGTRSLTSEVVVKGR